MADKHLLEQELEQLLSDAAATAVAEELSGLGQYDLGVWREIPVALGMLRLCPPVYLEAGRAVEEPVQWWHVLADGRTVTTGLRFRPSEELCQGVLELLHLLHGEVWKVVLLYHPVVSRHCRVVSSERADGEEAGLRPLPVIEMLLCFLHDFVALLDSNLLSCR
jgi:hypothetical protein